MIATTSPTFTTSSFWNLCSNNIPFTVEGISESTLSVAISITLSSNSIDSPTFLSH